MLCTQQLWGARLSCHRGQDGLGTFSQLDSLIWMNFSNLNNSMIPGPFGTKALGEEFVTCSLVSVVEKQSPSVPWGHLWSLLWWPASVQGRAGSGAALGMGSTTPGAQL